MLDCERRPSATSPSPESRTPRSITCPMRVLIAGCRYVDSALGVLLAAEAHPVLGLRRDTSKLSSPITPVQVDCSSPLPTDTLPPSPTPSSTPPRPADLLMKLTGPPTWMVRATSSRPSNRKRASTELFWSSAPRCTPRKGASGWMRNRPSSPRASPVIACSMASVSCPGPSCEHPSSRWHLRLRPDHHNRARFPRITKSLSSLES